eukprot:145043-Pelagomonas_calceolata.AAC.5
MFACRQVAGTGVPSGPQRPFPPLPLGPPCTIGDRKGQGVNGVLPGESQEGCKGAREENIILGRHVNFGLDPPDPPSPGTPLQLVTTGYNG